MRFTEAMVRLVDGGLLVQFKMPDQSTNRAQPDGEPEDVLLWEHPNFKDWGILRFKVGDIRSPLIREPDARDLHFEPSHEPEEFNFYHSEVAVFRSNVPRERLTRLSKAQKTWFRTEMSNVLNETNIHKEPVI